MEQDAKRLAASERSPGTLPKIRRDQDIMMEQNAKTIGRQAPEPHAKSDNGTEPQKTSETSPGTNPTQNQVEPGNDHGTECQKTRKQAPEPYPEPKNPSDCFLEELGIPFSPELIEEKV